MSGFRVATLVLAFASFATGAETSAPIDRQALVTRHNPGNRKADVDGTLTVGNGGFAFGADITGLQTFAEQYHRLGVPVETQSRWCWVTDPNPQKFTLADASRDFTNAEGRVIAYPTNQSSPAGDWLRRNPRSHPLGQILLDYTKADGSALMPEDIQKPEQKLDLWRGILTSQYEIEGKSVKVTTVCDPNADVVAVRIESEAVGTGKLKVKLAFPRGHDPATKNTPALDWSQPETHETRIAGQSGRAARLERNVSGTRYGVGVAWSHEAGFRQAGLHQFELTGASGNTLEFTVGFYQEKAGSTDLPGFQSVVDASTKHWEKFWREGAAVDFSGSTDPRADRIENRVILSRYLMAVQMAGDTPPQESGLTCNTWYGKHHSEMIWWHTAHFALWGNDELLAKNLSWFQKQLPAARELAKERGWRGARWAKMTGPDMRESPGGNPLIMWNQPHMVHLAELLYRNHPNRETLDRYRDLVLETAECLASMVHFDEAKGVYDLGPPLWIAQEIYDQATSRNPSFELAYWQWALETAQKWRERLGMPRDEKWDHIIGHLAPVPQKDGKYVALGSYPDTWDNIDSRHDHPTMLAPMGMLPGTGVERATMERTLDAVLANWDWETKIWGWDYPMIAMTAARLDRPETAVEILLREGPNNRYLPSGHCPQRSDEALTATAQPGARKREIAVYLPANGAFLSAVAMMVAGWDGRTGDAPGFPKDGKWKIRAEGLKPLP
ncbi:glycoside hydrolase N-terminal domain-containing protein [Luteolibacter sp.]|uniref:glycoside hydrolase N-terminal domain-containing protein n=1 Tax=Luteolibacter sp. TaxID=1962973 RepID=UPI003265887E